MTNTQNAVEEIVAEGEFYHVNFKIDHASLDFVGYEFKGKAFVEEIGEEEYLFRLDVYKESGEQVVHVAYSQDFDVMEDVTDSFDTEKLYEDVKKYIEENEDEVGNNGQTFVYYCQYKDEGYECDDAVYMAEARIDAEEKAEARIGDEDEPTDYALDQDRFDRGF